MRGLKHLHILWGHTTFFVAPHAGAWIETELVRKAKTLDKDVVAPHAGAWIETELGKGYDGYEIVAPHAGAWIETSYC